MRLRAPLADPIWRAPLVMATVTMLVTVALLCAAGLALLTREAFTAQTIGAALLVFFVVRPLAVYATTWRLALGRWAG